jgi:hypothetical protein
MEKAYWLSRKRASLKLAQNASSSRARLVQYDLAGRYSLKAMSAETMAIDLANALPPSIYSLGLICAKPLCAKRDQSQISHFKPRCFRSSSCWRLNVSAFHPIADMTARVQALAKQSQTSEVNQCTRAHRRDAQCSRD